MDLMSIVNCGAAAVRKNDAADNLRRSANALMRAISEYEGFGVVAASPQAERVLGAAMMLAPTIHGDSTGPSVIFDINYASGTMLARAARRLRDAGNQSPLVGIVLNPLIEVGHEIRVEHFDHVLVEPTRSHLREQRQRGIDRIAILAEA